jgi:hypothetical protein
MTDDSSISHRRKVLKQLAAGLSLTSLAGCAEDQQDNPVETTETASPTASDTQTETGTAEIKTSSPTHSETSEKTPTETRTETPDTISIFDLETKKEPELPGVWTEDHDLNNFNTELQLTAQTQNNTPIGETTVKDNDNDIISSWPGNNPTIQEKITQRIKEMQDGKNSYTATNTKHELETEATAETQIIDNYVIDFKNPDGENLGNYSSPHRKDDHIFDQAELNQYRTEWNNEVVYQNLITRLENDEDVEPEVGFTYYPNGEGTDYGHWDLQAFEDTTGLKNILKWVDTAVKVETFNQYNGPPSGHCNEMAATGERVINELHPEAETRAGSIYNPEIESGGSHGTMFFYDQSGESGWWHVDTTSETIVKPEEAQLHRTDVWSPFPEYQEDDPERGGFHKGPSQVENLSYEEKSNAAAAALESLINDADSPNNEYDAGKAFIPDEWLESAYDHIRNDGDIEPILEPLEQMVYTQVKEDEYIGIYGDSLEETKIMEGDEEIYEEVMEEPEAYSSSEIEQLAF